MASEWRDIATAPKDELIILACHGNVFPGFWHDGSDNYWGRAGWYELNQSPNFILTDKPITATHWLPLPDPPDTGDTDAN